MEHIHAQHYAGPERRRKVRGRILSKQPLWERLSNNKGVILAVTLVLPILWTAWRVAQIDPSLVPTQEWYEQVRRLVEAHAAEMARDDVQDECIRNLREGQVRIEQALRDQAREFASLNRELRNHRPISSKTSPSGARVGLAGLAVAAPRN